MVGFVIAAGFAGLAGSPHCVGMCGAFALSCGQRSADAIAWHAGRLATYAVLGAAAGAMGSVIPGPGWIGAVISGLLVAWFAAALAGLVPQPSVVVPGLATMASRNARQRGTLPRFVFGLANGLLPCGLVYAALSIPVAAADPVIGALAMIVFGVGTVPALSALMFGARRIQLNSLRARRIMAFGVLIAGLWSVAARQNLTTHVHDAEQTNQMSDNGEP